MNTFEKKTGKDAKKKYRFTVGDFRDNSHDHGSGYYHQGAVEAAK
jgi:hypothetical protein